MAPLMGMKRQTMCNKDVLKSYKFSRIHLFVLPLVMHFSWNMLIVCPKQLYFVGKWPNFSNYKNGINSLFSEPVYYFVLKIS